MHVYELKVLPSYERTLDPKGVQTFEGMKSQRNKGMYEGGRRRLTHSRLLKGFKCESK
jgi:hypothetical protein